MILGASAVGKAEGMDEDSQLLFATLVILVSVVIICVVIVLTLNEGSY